MKGFGLFFKYHKQSTKKFNARQIHDASLLLDHELRNKRRKSTRFPHWFSFFDNHVGYIESKFVRRIFIFILFFQNNSMQHASLDVVSRYFVSMFRNYFRWSIIMQSISLRFFKENLSFFAFFFLIKTNVFILQRFHICIFRVYHNSKNDTLNIFSYNKDTYDNFYNSNYLWYLLNLTLLRT